MNTFFVSLTIPSFPSMVPVSRVKWERERNSGKCISTTLQRGGLRTFSKLGGLVRVFHNFAVEGVGI